MKDEFANSRSSCVEWSVRFSPAGALEARSLRHFNDGGPAIEPPSSFDWCAERSGHSVVSVRTPKYFKETFAAVGER
jgi:hypothetical protein